MGTHHQAGYTLIEMLTGIGLSLVIAASAAPIASSVLDRYRLQSATRALAFEIARARMQAVGQNRATRLVLVDGGFAVEESTDGVTFTRRTSQTLPHGVGVEAGDSGAPRFDRHGLAPARTTLLVRSAAGSRALTTNVLGAVRIE